MSKELDKLVYQEWETVQQTNFWKAYTGQIELIRKLATDDCLKLSNELDSVRFNQGVAEACTRILRLPEKVAKPQEAGKE